MTAPATLARVARVRRVQHLQAAGEAAAAQGKLDALEGNAERLAALRASLAAGEAVSGAALGSVGELAARLDAARDTLAHAIGRQRETVTLRLAERTAADIARESAERLQVRAVAEMQRLIEERMAAAVRPRAPRPAGSNDA